MSDDLSGEWAPIKQAAALLGVSVDTVRRRIQRSELASRREETPQGYRWLVRIDIKPTNGGGVADDDAPGSPRTNEIAPHGSSQGPDSRDDLIAALRDELAHRTREISELHAIIGSQARALESTAALVAIPDRAASAENEAHRQVEPEPSPAIAALPEAPGFWERVRRVFTG